MEEIDYEKLRFDLIDYYGTAIFCGNPMSIIEVSRVETCSNQELIYIALQNGFDLSDYKKYKNR